MTRNDMSAITKIQISIEQLHGGERDRTAKYQSFIAWQIAQRQKEHGQEPSPILKK